MFELHRNQSCTVIGGKHKGKILYFQFYIQRNKAMFTDSPTENYENNCSYICELVENVNPSKGPRGT